jgi:hypothetical protein
MGDEADPVVGRRGGRVDGADRVLVASRGPICGTIALTLPGGWAVMSDVEARRMCATVEG